ncbi:hypothetical protein LB823_21410 [Tsukamurella sp. M9C]|uniref:hypothetical protein n=1 Tax=Tsukamurella sp. M9C TaxID=2877520 RepID=UPI001CCAB239|nr:hypothetical protein [Tsukamurella sp. M9C]MCA0158764.1 hypothetical protein [Tsukamurella sp. M9C]
METNSEDVAGSLDDVDAAAGAARKLASPWWMTAAWVIVFGVFWAAVNGDDHTWLGYLTIIGVFAVAVAGLVALRRRRGVTGFHAGGRASTLGFWSAFVVAMVLSAFMERGAVTTYIAIFVVAAGLNLAGELVERRAARRGSR